MKACTLVSIPLETILLSGCLGIEQALRAQRVTDSLASIVSARESAWQRADVQPTSSCYCAPGGER